jgi:acyl-CoA reductase-like NAD-dependent aldehyde dehydrogenase
MELAKKIAEIFPPGVINIVPGYGPEAGQLLIRHPAVRKLSFTGSTEVGRLIAGAGAEALLPITLELGGKSPNIVFPDVEDIDAVVDNVAFAGMYCNGQSCLAGTRLFLHADIYNDFTRRLVERLGAARIGAPFEESVTLTCLVSEKQGRRVTDYIRTGIDEGAKLLYGGERKSVAGHEAGWFIQPTLFEATNKMRIAREEIFGPVLSVIKWHDYESMIEQANDSEYGLASGLYTGNLNNALRTVRRLQAGSVWINQYFNLGHGTPFGGYKNSGLGREFSHETLKHYSQVKSVAIAGVVPRPFYIG